MANVRSDKYWGSQIPRLVDHGKHGRLNIRSVKIYTDGVFLPSTLLTFALIHIRMYVRRRTGFLGCCLTSTIL
jgi:hypothetical protein